MSRSFVARRAPEWPKLHYSGPQECIVLNSDSTSNFWSCCSVHTGHAGPWRKRQLQTNIPVRPLGGVRSSVLRVREGEAYD